MRRIALAFVAVAALAVASPAVAAPDPDDLVGVNPQTHFVACRILPNQREIVLQTYDWNDGALSTEQAIRQTILSFARTQRVNNPSWRIVIYGPIDPPSTFWTNDDRVWDSSTDL